MTVLTHLSRRGALAAAFAVAAAWSAPAFAETTSSWSPLIDPARAAALSSDGALVIDIRAQTAYGAGHVPGAVSAPYGLWRGPQGNPGQPLDDAALTALLQSIGAEVARPTIVVHQGSDSTDFGAAARVYWTLKAAGVERIAILNGGVNGWVDAGRALSQEAVVPSPSAITASLSNAFMAPAEDVAAISSGARDGALIDARPLSFYLGLAQHGAASAAGTIEGAARLEHTTWFGHRSARMIDDREFVRAIIERSGVLEEGAEVTVFCNTGHWAATTWFALSEVAGLENVRLYPGSMVDWTGAGREAVIGG